MSVSFTEGQQRAIDVRDKNILVSAAAGSGKTAVLVERIVRMVCDEKHPVDIDRLLVVTFTGAAAAQMRERISQGIAQRLRENPGSEYLERQAALLHNAQITTIDSFCLYLIRNHFQEIGLDPAFRIADEGEKKLLCQEVMEELLEDRFAEGDPDFTYCVEYFCMGGRESVLEKRILDLYSYAESCPWPQEWLEERKKDYDVETLSELENSPCGAYLQEYLSKMAAGVRQILEKALRLCQKPAGPYGYAETVEQELEQLRALEGCRTLGDWERELALASEAFGRLPAQRDKSVSLLLQERVKELRSQAREVIRELREGFFSVPLPLALERIKACAGPVGTLLGLALEFRERIQAKKQERKLIDFSDMEHYALDILLHRQEGRTVPSQVALEYRQYFQEILIDEYQDSNLVQEYLLGALSGEQEGHFNRFMVGDVKQCIYKFRLARPELFLEKYESYRYRGQDCERIDLSQNFRSRPQVVDAVNGVFSRLMSRDVGGICYDEGAALYPGAQYPENEGCQCELLLTEKTGPEDGLTVRQQEAAALAGEIKRLRESLRVTDRDTGQLRPVRYQDMVILLRTTSGWDEEFRQVLEGEGIPVHVTSRTGYFAATEVQEILQFLRVLDNPLQDIPLFGVMKSVFGGFDQEEIALLRSRDRGGFLWENVLEQAAGDEGELSRKCREFRERIERYRGYAVYMPVSELLRTAAGDFGYLNYVSALPGGEKRRANVEMLFAKAADFEKTSYFGLFHFVRYIEQLEKYKVDYGEAELVDESSDAVRIMSIHKSKGLEFAVTFVAGLAKSFSMEDANQSFLTDTDLGVGTDFADPVKRIRSRTLRRQILARKLREESLSEELRVLYVAMTRAREKLILSACIGKAQETWEKAMEFGGESLSFLEFMEAGSLLDFLLPVLPGTSVQVRTVTQKELQGQEEKEQLRQLGRSFLLENGARLADPQALRQLGERFSYRYAHENLSKLYTKTTVSELKIAAMEEKDEEAFRLFEEREVIPYIPAFRRQKEEPGGAAVGDAHHKVMELMDFAGVFGDGGRQGKDGSGETSGRQGEDGSVETSGWLRKNLEEFLDREVREERFSEEYRGLIRLPRLERFLQDPLASRMYRAQREGKLYREQPFVYGISASRLGKEFPEDEKVLIQGIIDAFFEEEGALVLVDYKTDRVNTPGELWNRYETQMDYYKEALEKLTALPVKERILYSFSLGRCVREGGR